MFPTSEELARAFYDEAARHLGDARVLYSQKRYPGSITSSLKAIELSLQAVCIHDGSMGWWEETQKTHRTLHSIEKNVVLKKHASNIDRANPLLIGRIMEAERLIPESAKFTVEASRDNLNANSEYPFLAIHEDPMNPSEYIPRLERPARFFQHNHSLELYSTARDLMITMGGAYQDVRNWKVRIPRAL